MEYEEIILTGQEVYEEEKEYIISTGILNKDGSPIYRETEQHQMGFLVFGE